MTRTPVVLGVESSCDETGFGLVSEGTLLGQGLASSASQHAEFGGVVPEIAALRGPISTRPSPPCRSP